MRKLFVLLGVLSVVLHSCSSNNVNEDNSLKQYFDEFKVTGCFGQFNNSRGEFTIYNLPRFADSAYLPANTFDIVTSIVALETSVMQNDSSKMTVIDKTGDDTTNCGSAEMAMNTAFRNSCTSWFIALAHEIGKEKMQFWLDSLGYGRRYGKPEVKEWNSFWLDNSVKITADEQLGLIKKVYFEQLPPKKWTQRSVNQMMLITENNQYKLAYKTGFGRTDKGTNLGWVLGWIEENKHPYPFVLQFESADTTANMKVIGTALLDKILTHYEFKKGKK